MREQRKQFFLNVNVTILELRTYRTALQPDEDAGVSRFLVLDTLQCFFLYCVLIVEEYRSICSLPMSVSWEPRQSQVVHRWDPLSRQRRVSVQVFRDLICGCKTSRLIPRQ